METPTSKELIEHLREDCRISAEEAGRVLSAARANLKDLVAAMEKSGANRQWQLLLSLNSKLEAFAINVKWQRLRKFCTLLAQAAESENTRHVDALLSKLPSIVRISDEDD